MAKAYIKPSSDNSNICSVYDREKKNTMGDNFCYAENISIQEAMKILKQLENLPTSKVRR